MFPVGDPGSGSIQRHAKWCGPEHTGHLRVGVTRLAVGHIAPMRIGGGWLIWSGMISDWLVAHGPVFADGHYAASMRRLVHRLSCCCYGLPDPAARLSRAA